MPYEYTNPAGYDMIVIIRYLIDNNDKRQVPWIGAVGYGYFNDQKSFV